MAGYRVKRVIKDFPLYRITAMTLADFLVNNSPLVSVDLLPDQRLMNVVIGDGKLYGVKVENLPNNVPLTRSSAGLDAQIITTESGLTFDTTQYEMLNSPQP